MRAILDKDDALVLLAALNTFRAARIRSLGRDHMVVGAERVTEKIKAFIEQSTPTREEAIDG